MAFHLAKRNVVYNGPSKKKLFEQIKIAHNSVLCFSKYFVNSLGYKMLQIHRSILISILYISQMFNHVFGSCYGKGLC